MNELKKLQLRTDEDIRYPEDVDKIVEDFKQHGYEISRSDAYTAWINYSNSYDAGWLNGVELSDTFNVLEKYFIEEE
jgi:hypothetical protein